MLWYVFLCITDLASHQAFFAAKVDTRLKGALKDKTWNSYKNMFLLFLAFSDFLGADGCSPSVFCILAFIEFLAFNMDPYSTTSVGLNHSWLGST